MKRVKLCTNREFLVERVRSRLCELFPEASSHFLHITSVSDRVLYLGDILHGAGIFFDLTFDTPTEDFILIYNPRDFDEEACEILKTVSEAMFKTAIVLSIEHVMFELEKERKEVEKRLEECIRKGDVSEEKKCREQLNGLDASNRLLFNSVNSMRVEARDIEDKAERLAEAYWEKKGSRRKRC